MVVAPTPTPPRADGWSGSTPPVRPPVQKSAEPALAPLPCPFCDAAMAERHGPGIPIWDHPKNDCLLSEWALTSTGLEPWNRRPAIARLHDSLNREVAEREWRPIESAPADDECFLVCDDRLCGGHMEVVFIDPAEPHLLQTQDGPSFALAAFTHWQPLPRAPREPLPDRPQDGGGDG